ncbi:MAG: hypothetical protein ACRD33_00050 [Candidatus Acidiferrales bacterium]
MTLPEFFDSLTHAERVRVQFYPPMMNSPDMSWLDQESLKILQARWESLLKGDGFARSAPGSADVEDQLQRFLRSRGP